MPRLHPFAHIKCQATFGAWARSPNRTPEEQAAIVIRRVLAWVGHEIREHRCRVLIDARLSTRLVRGPRHFQV